MADKIGIVIPTCNKDRKSFLDFLLSRIDRQTKKVDTVNVVDFSNAGNNDIYLRYKKGTEELFTSGCNFVIFMEDDDYYPLTYVNDFYNKWIEHGRPIILGSWPTRYYHILNEKFRIYPDLAWCSAHCTAVAPGINLDVCTKGDVLFDKNLWEKNSGVKFMMGSGFMVSIKHGIGMSAGRTHQVRNMTDDRDFKILKAWVDKEAYDFYITKIKDSGMKINHGERLKQEAGYIKKYLPMILKGGLSVLDIGTGPGEFLQICQTHNCQNVGIDVEKYKNHKNSNLNILYANARDLFENITDSFGPYDIINCKHVLNLIMKSDFNFPLDTEGKYHNDGSWIYGPKMDDSFTTMFYFLKHSLKENGIFMVSAHHCSDEKQYSEYIKSMALKCGFNLDKEFSNLIHRFKKV